MSFTAIYWGVMLLWVAATFWMKRR